MSDVRPDPRPDIVLQVLADRAAAAQVTIAGAEGERIAWPGVVTYRYDGAEHPLPPVGGAAPATPGDLQGIEYSIRVRDLALYDYLAATGLLYSPAHRGRAAIAVDRRKAPGA